MIKVKLKPKPYVRLETNSGLTYALKLRIL